jgi:triacylglycerol lipase
MPMVLDATKPGDSRNALFLAEACNLAYFDEPVGVNRFRDELGLESRLISVGNTQVYVAQNDKALVVAFRGSQAPTTLDGLKDWLLTNANNYLILPEGQIGTDFAAAGVGARFHRGFMEALHEIWEPLLASVTKATEASDCPLWVTGHSLGGALALLAAWRLQRNFLTVHEVVTFGAPMIGNEAAARAFEQEFAGKIFRYVNLEDPVPLLPSVSLVANTYAHCQSEVSLAALAAVVSALDTLKESAGSAVDRLIEASQIDHLWKVVQGRISAHFIDHYQERVKVKCGDGGVSSSAAEVTMTTQTDTKGELLEANPGGVRSDHS